MWFHNWLDEPQAQLGSDFAPLLSIGPWYYAAKRRKLSEKDNRQHLGREDAEQRGQRIDRGVSDGGRIETGCVGSERQRRWIRHAAGDQTAQVDEVQFEDAAGEHTHAENRQHCHACTGQQPLQAGGRKNRGEELRARPTKEASVLILGRDRWRGR